MKYIYMQLPTIDPDLIDNLYAIIRKEFDLDESIMPSSNPDNQLGFYLFANAVRIYIKFIFELITDYFVDVSIAVTQNKVVFITLITDRGSFHIFLDRKFKVKDSEFWRITQMFWQLYLNSGD